MLTAGNAVRFRLGESTEVLRSGDALVMDAMATLHGVEEVLPPGPGDQDLDNGIIVDPAECLGIPAGSRLGVLLWMAAPEPPVSAIDADSDQEGDLGIGFMNY